MKPKNKGTHATSTLPKGMWVRLINHGPLVLVTSGDERRPNVAPVAWTTPLSDDPPYVGIALYRKHHTSSLIRRHKSFVINVPEIGLLEQVKYFGSVSGRNVNKIQRSKLILAPGLKVKTPHIAGCVGFIECRSEKIIKVGEELLFVSRVLGAHIRRDLNKGGMISAKAKTFHHMGGGVFRLTGAVRHD